MKSKYLISSRLKGGLCTLVENPHPLEFTPKTTFEHKENQAMMLIEAGETRKGRAILESLYSQGDLWAGNTLAYGIQVGWFGKRGYKKALTILMDLADKGYDMAINNLGFTYQMGLGVKTDYKLAMSLYEKAIELGCKVAVTNLALLLFFGARDIRDYKRVVDLCSDPQMAEDGEAMNTLGRCYEEGKGVEQDLQKAHHFYKLAVIFGAGPAAERNLSRIERKEQIP